MRFALSSRLRNFWGSDPRSLFVPERRPSHVHDRHPFKLQVPASSRVTATS